MDHTAVDPSATETVIHRRITRRELIQVLGLSGLTIGLGDRVARANAGAFAQDTRPDQPRQVGGPTIAAKAAELDFDPMWMFAFVRDEIRFDPYEGVLRGATGCLWGRAGNALDQALLLATLLDHAQVTTRFAIGELSSAASDTLLATAVWTERDLHDQATQVLGQSVTQDTNLTSKDTHQLTTSDPPAPAANRILQTARDQASTALTSITDGFDSVGFVLPPLQATLPAGERQRHVWVQFADGDQWIDLDPTLPGAEAGTSSTTPTETTAKIPDEMFHRVVVRLTAEVVTGGVATMTTLLTYEARVADLTGMAVTVVHIGSDALAAGGFATITGVRSYVPHVFAGDEVIVGEPVVFPTGEGIFDLFDDGPPDGDTLGEWLTIEVIAPDGTAQSASRDIFDRIGVTQRALGPVGAEDAVPVELTDLPELGETYAPLAAVIDIATVNTKVPAAYFAQDFAIDDFVSDSSLVNHAYHYVRDSLQADAAHDLGYRVFSNQPHVSLFVQAPTGIVDNEPVLEAFIDIVHQGVGVALMADAADEPSRREQPDPRVVSGVLAHIAERTLLEGAVDETGVTPPSSFLGVSHLFEAARAEGIALHTLTSTDELNLIQCSDEARVRISAALADDRIVIVPQQPVTLGGRSLTGWWEIHTDTGFTVDRLENGRSQVLGEYSVLLSTIWRSYKLYRCLIGIRTMAIIVVGILSGQVSSDPGVTVNNAASVRHCAG